MANTFEALITKFNTRIVDEYFVQESKSVILENGRKYMALDFTEAGYVKVASILLDGLSDYYQHQEATQPSNPADYAAYAGNVAASSRDGLALGGATVEWEIYKLQWKRGRRFEIDHISNEETGNVLLGNLFEQFNKLKVIPEVDAARFSTIADCASVSLGNLVVGASITTTNDETGIMHRIVDAETWLANHGVPADSQAIFISYTDYALLRTSNELVKFLSQGDIRNGDGVTLKVEKFGVTPIIPVPDDRFFTKFVAGSNGYYAGAGSQKIRIMVCDIRAVIPIRKIEWAKLYDENQAGVLGFYGKIFNYLLYHGCIVPRNKMVGCYVYTGAANSGLAVTNLLSVDIREGDVTNAWKLRAFFTNPAGLRGTVVYATTDVFTVGGSVTSTGDTDSDGVVEEGEVYAIGVDEQKVDAVNTQLYFALVDASGKCIAKSGQVTLIKKA